MLALTSLSVRNIRNLQEVDIEPGPALNVISGDNGHGKTNLVEAIYVAATTRSFRASGMREVVTRGHREGSTSIRVSERVPAARPREWGQSVGIRGGARLLRIDGQPVGSAIQYATRTPVVAFSPAELALSTGPGKARRKLLDRVALYESPAAAEDVQRMARAQRCRQRALEGGRTKGTDVDAWEDLVVRHGMATMRARAVACERLAGPARDVFAEIAGTASRLDLRYVPSAPPDPDAFASALRATRDVDARRPAASVGPHRDDVILTIGGVPVRGFASQGEHRACVLALKAAELDVVGLARGARPVLLLDDVSSELDRERARAFLGFLDRQAGQAFVTTTRPDLIETSGRARRDYAVEQGRVKLM